MTALQTPAAVSTPPYDSSVSMTTNRYLGISGFLFFVLLALSTCISKSVDDILFAVLMLLSIGTLASAAGRRRFIGNRLAIPWLLPLLVGFCISFFSLCGPAKGSAGFLQQYRFFFLILPAILFIKSEKNTCFLFWALNLSAFASVVYGFSTINPRSLWAHQIGFHYIGRASDLLISIGLINLTVLASHPIKKKSVNMLSKTVIGVNTVFILCAVLFMSRRGSYLGLLAGIFTLLILLKKKKLLALFIIAFCASLFFSSFTAVQRVDSIVDFKGDHSTRERIELFRTGSAFVFDRHLFFRGTGAKMSVKPYTEYFYTHSSDYQEKNKDIVQRNYFGNFHNSFLQMTVEYGLFFLLCYLTGIAYLMVRFSKSLSRQTRSRRIYPLTAVVVTAGFFISQLFHGDLYSYGGLPFVMALAAGCAMMNPKKMMEGVTESP